MPILARCRLAGGAIYALSPTRSAALDGPNRCTARSQWSARVLSAFSQLSGSPDTDSLARAVAQSVFADVDAVGRDARFIYIPDLRLGSELVPGQQNNGLRPSRAILAAPTNRPYT